MFVKFHRTEDNYVTAICDEELIGKEFSEKDLQLNVSEYFYKGELKDKEEVKTIMKDSPNMNLVGKKTIKLAIEINELDKDGIIKIQGIPHAQIVKL